MTKTRAISEIINPESLKDTIRATLYQVLEFEAHTNVMLFELVSADHTIDIPKIVAEQFFGDSSLDPASPTYFDDFHSLEWFYNEQLKKEFSSFPEWVEIFFGYNERMWSYGINMRIKKISN